MRAVHVLCLGLVLLSGCSSLSETQCRTGEWEEIGEHDGAHGAPQHRSVDHQKACAEYGVEVDAEAYFRGYERGLEQYCTANNAVRLGVEGAAYAGVCPVELYPTFEAQYRAGYVVYEQRQRVLQLESRAQSLDYDLQRAQTDEQQRYIRGELYRLDRALRVERERLYYAEQALRDMTRGIL